MKVQVIMADKRTKYPASAAQLFSMLYFLGKQESLQK